MDASGIAFACLVLDLVELYNIRPPKVENVTEQGLQRHGEAENLANSSNSTPIPSGGERCYPLGPNSLDTEHALYFDSRTKDPPIRVPRDRFMRKNLHKQITPYIPPRFSENSSRISLPFSPMALIYKIPCPTKEISFPLLIGCGKHQQSASLLRGVLLRRIRERLACWVVAEGCGWNAFYEEWKNESGKRGGLHLL
ncbi:hypothetical protein I7I51_04335 [Histoplasma capsulatum]|uniref:Uncharacterized protein n=1 Tax=Ajellomyces capsulatus TaxID=5037 RepID=A0A8A1M6N1_AJECA|nr:hypothetical protein I7I51_04335 [Histoplasma capsulatum]